MGRARVESGEGILADSNFSSMGFIWCQLLRMVSEGHGRQEWFSGSGREEPDS